MRATAVLRLGRQVRLERPRPRARASSRTTPGSAYIPATSFRSMEAAKSAAEAMADKLNAEDRGVTVRPGDGDSRTARGTSEEDT